MARLLAPHFLSEEEFALPPLGLLTLLAHPQGKEKISPEDAKVAITMADRLSSEMLRMLAEHLRIVAALWSLIAAAQAESHRDVAAFA